MPQENWKDIHNNFAQKKKYWEERGFSYEEVEEWIESDLAFWEYELAIYLGEKGHEQKLANLQEFRNQFWLDKIYPMEERSKIIFLNIESKNLTGSSKLKEFINLRELNCSENKLTSLEIANCPKLNILRCSRNQINQLVIDNCPSLTFFSCSGNQLNNLDFFSIDHHKNIVYLDLGSNNFPSQDLSFLASFVNLEELRINNNPFFGSLKTLQKLKKLKTLDVTYTKISESWEYLDKNIEEISLGVWEELVERMLTYGVMARTSGELKLYQKKRKQTLFCYSL